MTPSPIQPDTSEEAVERMASIIVKPLSTLKESFEAAAMLRSLQAENAQLRADPSMAGMLMVQSTARLQALRSVEAERDALRQQLADANAAMADAERIVGDLEGVSITYYLRMANADETLTIFDAAIDRARG